MVLFHISGAQLFGQIRVRHHQGWERLKRRRIRLDRRRSPLKLGVLFAIQSFEFARLLIKLIHIDLHYIAEHPEGYIFIFHFILLSCIISLYLYHYNW